MRKLLLFVIVLLTLPMTTAAAQDGDTYTDPLGRFTVPIPTNWTAETVESDDATYARLLDPDGALPVYVLVVEAPSVSEGISAAWAVIDPALTPTPVQEQEIPAPEGVDEMKQIIYTTEDENIIAAGIGQRVGDQVYVLLAAGDLTVFQQRNAQVVIILTGLDILSVEEATLTDVEARPIDDAILEELDAFIAQAMIDFEVPGAAVAIVQNGEIILLQGYGVKEQGGTDPITPDTHMMIGSTGKTMTTLLMAMEVDDGTFDWDTPVTDILPTFAVADPERTAQIEMRHLVCACTGVPRRDLELLFNANDLSAEDIIESLQTFDFFTDFGEAFQYSNQMVGTAGYITALADGGTYGSLFDDYAALMQARVFAPIGMNSTTFDFDEVVASGDYAIPHGAFLDGTYKPIQLSTEQTLIPIAPAGSSWSTPHDMAQYLIFQLNDGVAASGDRLVSEENLNETRRPQIPIDASTSYGLGWLIGDYKGLQFIEHGGNTLGFTSELFFIPDAGLGISVLTNAQASNLFNTAVRTRLLELVYDQEPKIADEIQALITQSETQYAQLMVNISEEIDPEAVQPFLGTYTNEVLGEVTLSLNDEGEFIADTGEFSTSLWLSTGDNAEPNTYVTASAPLVGTPIVFRETDGTPELIIGEGILSYVFTHE